MFGFAMSLLSLPFTSGLFGYRNDKFFRHTAADRAATAGDCRQVSLAAGYGIPWRSGEKLDRGDLPYSFAEFNLISIQQLFSCDSIPSYHI